MGIIARIKGEEPGLIGKIPHALRGKGHYGEFLTEYALEHGGLGHVVVLSNVLVPRASGPTSASEIDVVMLHEKGIFVFESKNYSGWIFGSENQRNWTVTLNANTKKQFYNPIKQNRAHVKALAAYLKVDVEKFRSYIVFSERCRLKKVPSDTFEYTICKRNNLLKTLRADIKWMETAFSEAEFRQIEEKLRVLSEGSGSEAKSEHIREAKLVASGKVCPRCGSALVERNGKYGAFIGCSAYPKCRYTRDV